jgi:hypothetical protein
MGGKARGGLFGHLARLGWGEYLEATSRGMDAVFTIDAVM